MSVSTRRRRRRIWLIPATALIAVMGIPALLNGRPVLGQDTPVLIQQILANPLTDKIPALLPLAKLLLVVVAALAVLGLRHSARLLVTYYAAALVALGVFQNAADLGARGIAFLAGNAVAQLALAVCCLISLRSVKAQAVPLRSRRMWVLPFAGLAAAFPYSTADGHVVPSLDGMLTNDAGVTYCMVTTVVAAAMFLRPDAFPAWLRVAVATLGALFGALNAVTWFVLAPQSWWMGVLHLPLLACSSLLLATSWTDARSPAPRCEDVPEQSHPSPIK